MNNLRLKKIVFSLVFLFSFSYVLSVELPRCATLSDPHYISSSGTYTLNDKDEECLKNFIITGDNITLEGWDTPFTRIAGIVIMPSADDVELENLYVDGGFSLWDAAITVTTKSGTYEPYNASVSITNCYVVGNIHGVAIYGNRLVRVAGGPDLINWVFGADLYGLIDVGANGYFGSQYARISNNGSHGWVEVAPGEKMAGDVDTDVRLDDNGGAGYYTRFTTTALHTGIYAEGNAIGAQLYKTKNINIYGDVNNNNSIDFWAYRNTNLCFESLDRSSASWYKNTVSCP